jgi:hypothetical protein
MASIQGAVTLKDIDTQDDALATATFGADANLAYYVTGVSASFDNTVNGATLLVLDGVAEIYKAFVWTTGFVQFGRPLEITKGAAASATLSASGTGGVNGTVCLHGFSTRS